MRPLLTAEQMRELDARTIEEAHVPGLILMENAGLKSFQALYERFGSVAGMQVILLCGKGNNGGDGFVIGRHLINHGAAVKAYLFAKKADVKGDARANLDAFIGTGGELVDQAGSAAKLEELRADLMESDVAVDALFGTGLSSEVNGPVAQAIEILNNAALFVLAVDIPSGVEADTGQVLGAAVMADLTCTYGGMKVGQWQHPGRAHCGELLEVEISIPALYSEELATGIYLLDSTDLWPGLLHRLPDTHKGHYGHLLVIAGSHGKSGAAVLACRGAHRIGAGLVTLAVPSGLEAVVAPQSPETMTALLEENAAGGISEGVAPHLLDLLEQRTAALIGPGIPTDKETGRALEKFLKEAAQPLVIDADGLNLLAANNIQPRDLTSKAIIVTPHPGEMSRLAEKSTRDIQARRIETAREYAAQQGVICVLKGASTVIADPDGNAYICPSGNAGLATGGTGDVLAGMIAGLLVQEGVSPLEACASAVLLHGLAADHLAARGGEASLLAGDLVREFPAVLHQIHEELHHHHHGGAEGEEGPGGSHGA